MRNKLNIHRIKLGCFSYGDMHQLFNSWLSDKNSRSHSLASINVNCRVSAINPLRHMVPDV